MLWREFRGLGWLEKLALDLRKLFKLGRGELTSDTAKGETTGVTISTPNEKLDARKVRGIQVSGGAKKIQKSEKNRVEKGRASRRRKH